MPIEQCQKLILLYRLRRRAKGCIAAHNKSGNLAVAQIYARIDAWLEVQMSHIASGAR